MIQLPTQIFYLCELDGLVEDEVHERVEAAEDPLDGACKHEIPIESFASIRTSYEVVFNKRDSKSRGKKKRGGGGEDDEVDGPVVERKCPKCGHERMSYAALQLRSADKVQTVFFTCLRCKFKESENS